MSGPQQQLSRRELLRRSSTGFGALAFAGLFGQPSLASELSQRPRRRAKNVIFCYMSGGVSHVDSFDPKPKLAELHGKPMPMQLARTQFNQNGNVMASPFRFAQHGESGTWVSSLFPHLATVADELAVVRSMTSEFS